MNRTYIDKYGTPQPDRRQFAHLRDVFDGFKAVVAPFLGNASSWGIQDLSYLARRQIQESFPQLSAQETQVLLTAVSRVIRDESGERTPEGTTPTL